MATYKVGYFIGSLSSKSINRELSRALFVTNRCGRPSRPQSGFPNCPRLTILRTTPTGATACGPRKNV
jgi:hypothetical protein